MISDKQKKLIENYIRIKVKKMLNEAPENQDLEYLYKILKTFGPKIDKPLRNVVVNSDKNDPEFQNLLRIEKAWNDFTFGIGSYYHKKKKPN